MILLRFLHIHPRQSGARLPGVFPWGAVVGLFIIAAASADRVLLIDGTGFDAQVIGMDEQGRLQTTHPQHTRVGWSEIQVIERSDQGAVSSNRPAWVVFLPYSSQVSADRVLVERRRCQIFGSLLGNQAWLSLDQVRGLLLEVPKTWPSLDGLDADFQKVWAGSERMTMDQIWVRTDSGLQRVEGTLEAIDDRQVRWVWNDRDRLINLSRVRALVLAQPAMPGSDPTPNARIHGRDGSIVSADLTGWKDGKLQLSLGVAEIDLAWESVQRIEAINPRLVYLSDLEPVRVWEDYFPSAGWSWQRDRTVTGDPMLMGGQVFRRGLGVHAHCVLEYALEGRYAWFMATIGLTPPSPAVGDCLFVVQGDGRELLRQRLRGNDPPQDIRLSVQGVGRLTLAVEPGENFDLGDHANWAEARLLKADTSGP